MDPQPLNLNKPQKRIVLANPSESSFVASRATGKSWLIAWLMRTIDKTMPGSKWGIACETYKQAKTRTLPSTLGGLRALGYQENYNLFVNRRPPAKFNIPTCLEPPLDYENFIQMPRGAGFSIISLDGNGSSGRGLNLDGIITDETLNINKEKFDSDVVPANRGKLRYWGNVPMHHGVFHFTSMPYAKEQMWILQDGNYYEDDGYDFTSIRNEIIKLELQFIDDKHPVRRIEVWRKIHDLKKQLKFYKSKEGHLYSEADIFDNILNIGIKYVEQQRRILTDFFFLTEILNKRPGVVEGGYYPLLGPHHFYSEISDTHKLAGIDVNQATLISSNSTYDEDCIRTRPLRLAVDWGGKISVLSIAQFLGMEYRFLKDMYVKHPQLIDELANLFCNYYFFHPTKELDFIPDIVWGNRRTPNSKLTYNQQFISRLRSNGWKVNELNIGMPINDQDMYLLWYRILKEDEESILHVRINRHNCPHLIRSMQNTPIKMGNKGMEKDKSSERSNVTPQEEATHFTDTADNHILSIGKELLEQNSNPIPNLY